MRLFAIAIIQKSILFVIFILFFWCIHHYFRYGFVGFQLPVVGSILAGLVIGSLITYIQYITYGISNVRLLSGESRKYICLNSTQKLIMPFGYDDAYSYIRNFITSIWGSDSGFKEEPLDKIIYYEPFHTIIFRFDSIDKDNTEVEISSRIGLHCFYDFAGSKKIVKSLNDFLLKRLKEPSQDYKQEAETVKRNITRAMGGGMFVMNLLPILPFVLLMLAQNIDLIPGNTLLEIRTKIDKPFGRITVDDCSEITSLSLSDRNIYSLKGIELCVNLHELDLSNNKIRNLEPLQNLKNLEILNLDSNRISNIEFLASMGNLKSLNLSNNRIDSLDTISNLKKLTELRIGYNEITDFSILDELTKLETIGLEGYEFADLRIVSGLLKLKNLFFSDNDVSDLSPLVKLSELEYLELNNNQVTDISPLTNLTHLVTLELENNLISDISALENVMVIKLINLKGNNIEDISVLAEMDLPAILDLSRNSIHDISILLDADNLNESTQVNLKKNILNWKSIVEYLPQLKEKGIDIRF